MTERPVELAPVLHIDTTPRQQLPGTPPKRATMIAQRIVHSIREGRLAPGDALPGEKEMLAAYGVGRNTLREALRVLELQGVIALKPGRGGGPVVARPDSRHLASTLALLMQFAQTPFGSIVETRLHLEPLTAQMCAARADDEVALQIRDSVSRMARGLDDEDIFLHENQRFHELVATGADNPIFSYLLNSLNWITDGSALGVHYPVPARKSVLGHHEKVCSAIERHDPEAASAAMRVHLGATVDYLGSKHPSVMERRLTWEMYGG